ncbi:hypothetical protein FQA39_LY14521 [Lamprigera yunnana]|nr:hypothetical protein FQA39_LY14521 [Lamprigera yunnana]
MRRNVLVSIVWIMTIINASLKCDDSVSNNVYANQQEVSHIDLFEVSDFDDVVEVRNRDVSSSISIITTQKSRKSKGITTKKFITRHSSTTRKNSPKPILKISAVKPEKNKKNAHTKDFLKLPPHSHTNTKHLHDRKENHVTLRSNANNVSKFAKFSSSVTSRSVRDKTKKSELPRHVSEYNSLKRELRQLTEEFKQKCAYCRPSTFVDNLIESCLDSLDVSDLKTKYRRDNDRYRSNDDNNEEDSEMFKHGKDISNDLLRNRKATKNDKLNKNKIEKILKADIYKRSKKPNEPNIEKSKGKNNYQNLKDIIVYVEPDYGTNLPLKPIVCDPLIQSKDETDTNVTPTVIYARPSNGEVDHLAQSKNEPYSIKKKYSSRSNRFVPYSRLQNSNNGEGTYNEAYPFEEEYRTKYIQKRHPICFIYRRNKRNMHSGRKPILKYDKRKYPTHIEQQNHRISRSSCAKEEEEYLQKVKKIMKDILQVEQIVFKINTGDLQAKETEEKQLPHVSQRISIFSTQSPTGATKMIANITFPFTLDVVKKSSTEEDLIKLHKNILKEIEELNMTAYALSPNSKRKDVRQVTEMPYLEVSQRITPKFDFHFESAPMLLEDELKKIRQSDYNEYDLNDPLEPQAAKKFEDGDQLHALERKSLKSYADDMLKISSRSCRSDKTELESTTRGCASKSDEDRGKFIPMYISKILNIKADNNSSNFATEKMFVFTPISRASDRLTWTASLVNQQEVATKYSSDDIIHKQRDVTNSFQDSYQKRILTTLEYSTASTKRLDINSLPITTSGDGNHGNLISHSRAIFNFTIQNKTDHPISSITTNQFEFPNAPITLPYKRKTNTGESFAKNSNAVDFDKDYKDFQQRNLYKILFPSNFEPTKSKKAEFDDDLNIVEKRKLSREFILPKVIVLQPIKKMHRAFTSHLRSEDMDGKYFADVNDPSFSINARIAPLTLHIDKNLQPRENQNQEYIMVTLKPFHKRINRRLSLFTREKKDKKERRISKANSRTNFNDNGDYISVMLGNEKKMFPSPTVTTSRRLHFKETTDPFIMNNNMSLLQLKKNVQSKDNESKKDPSSFPMSPYSKRSTSNSLITSKFNYGNKLVEGLDNYIDDSETETFESLTLTPLPENQWESQEIPILYQYPETESNSLITKRSIIREKTFKAKSVFTFPMDDPDFQKFQENSLIPTEVSYPESIKNIELDTKFQFIRKGINKPQLSQNKRRTQNNKKSIAMLTMNHEDKRPDTPNDITKNTESVTTNIIDNCQISMTPASVFKMTLAKIRSKQKNLGPEQTKTYQDQNVEVVIPRIKTACLATTNQCQTTTKKNALKCKTTTLPACTTSCKHKTTACSKLKSTRTECVTKPTVQLCKTTTLSCKHKKPTSTVSCKTTTASCITKPKLKICKPTTPSLCTVKTTVNCKTTKLTTKPQCHVKTKTTSCNHKSTTVKCKPKTTCTPKIDECRVKTTKRCNRTKRSKSTTPQRCDDETEIGNCVNENGTESTTVNCKTTTTPLCGVKTTGPKFVTTTTKPLCDVKTKTDNCIDTTTTPCGTKTSKNCNRIEVTELTTTLPRCDVKTKVGNCAHENVTKSTTINCKSTTAPSCVVKTHTTTPRCNLKTTTADCNHKDVTKSTTINCKPTTAPSCGVKTHTTTPRCNLKTTTADCNHKDVTKSTTINCKPTTAPSCGVKTHTTTPRCNLKTTTADCNHQDVTKSTTINCKPTTAPSCGVKTHTTTPRCNLKTTTADCNHKDVTKSTTINCKPTTAPSCGVKTHTTTPRCNLKTTTADCNHKDVTKSTTINCKPTTAPSCGVKTHTTTPRYCNHKDVTKSTTINCKSTTAPPCGVKTHTTTPRCNLKTTTADCNHKDVTKSTTTKCRQKIALKCGLKTTTPNCTHKNPSTSTAMQFTASPNQVNLKLTIEKSELVNVLNSTKLALSYDANENYSSSKNASQVMRQNSTKRAKVKLEPIDKSFHSASQSYVYNNQYEKPSSATSEFFLNSQPEKTYTKTSFDNVNLMGLLRSVTKSTYNAEKLTILGPRSFCNQNKLIKPTENNLSCKHNNSTKSTTSRKCTKSTTSKMFYNEDRNIEFAKLLSEGSTCSSKAQTKTTKRSFNSNSSEKTTEPCLKTKSTNATKKCQKLNTANRLKRKRRRFYYTDRNRKFAGLEDRHVEKNLEPELESVKRDRKSFNHRNQHILVKTLRPLSVKSDIVKLAPEIIKRHSRKSNIEPKRHLFRFTQSKINKIANIAATSSSNDENIIEITRNKVSTVTPKEIKMKYKERRQFKNRSVKLAKTNNWNYVVPAKPKIYYNKIRNRDVTAKRTKRHINFEDEVSTLSYAGAIAKNKETRRSGDTSSPIEVLNSQTKLNDNSKTALFNQETLKAVENTNNKKLKKLFKMYHLKSIPKQIQESISYPSNDLENSNEGKFQDNKTNSSLVDVNQAEEVASLPRENLSNLSALEYEEVTVNSNETNRVNVTTCADTSEVSDSSNVIEYSPTESTNSNEQKITETEEMISTAKSTVEEVGETETVTLSFSKKSKKRPTSSALLHKKNTRKHRTTSSLGLSCHSKSTEYILKEIGSIQCMKDLLKESTCSVIDYLNRDSCYCSIDNLIADLRLKLNNNHSLKLDNYICPVLINIDKGIELKNSRVTHIFKRFLRMENYLVNRRDVIHNHNIEKVLSEPLGIKINSINREISATPGSKIQLPCINNADLDENFNYSWTFSDNLLLTAGRVQEYNGFLIIDNVTPQDGGNYTCTVTTAHGDGDVDLTKYEHRLSIVALPTYSLTTQILYNSSQRCQPADIEIISLYFPNMLETFICGTNFKVCKITVHEPKCHSQLEEYITLKLTVAIETLNTMIPGINTLACNVKCEMSIYSHIIMFIVRNMENIEGLPVFVTLPYRQVKFTPIVEIENEADIFKTELPKLNIACPPGFGYLHKTRACGACQRNTFNKGAGTKCVACPVGQYQPLPGSKSCLSCSNPLQDPYCLRIVYSNTNRFRILLGVIIAVILMIILCLIWCQCFKIMKVGNVADNRSYKRRKKNYECQLRSHNELKNMKFRRSLKYSKVPPEPPSPDFS